MPGGGGSKGSRAKPCSVRPTDGMMDTIAHQSKRRFFFFCEKVVKVWQRLPGGFMESPSLEILKIWLDVTLNILTRIGSWAGQSLEMSHRLRCSLILCHRSTGWNMSVHTASCSHHIQLFNDCVQLIREWSRNQECLFDHICISRLSYGHRMI